MSVPLLVGNPLTILVRWWLIMKIGVAEATRKDEHTLERLFQLYQYDFSEMMGGDVEDDGVFHYISFGDVWEDNRAHVFIVRVDGRLAGVAIVIERSHFSGDTDVTFMDEFFVMRKYRRTGVGSAFATRLFDRFPGRWEVAEVAPNTDGAAFWRAVIGTYTSGKFDERIEDSDKWIGPVQTFDARERMNAKAQVASRTRRRDNV